ncbi:HD domain-containing protein [Phosphitispora sp. TUW77]|uniref:HD domain-containing protein n=1 Tax=Phosphitispora sp. TUW77 TaxID=3152361 RepID=UPI003AB496D6
MDRLDRLLKDELYRGYLDKNAVAEKNRKFCKHTFQHMVDVARITYILLLETGDIRSFMEKNDFNLYLAREIIYAAALLHDIGRWKEYAAGEDHAVTSAELAEELLQKAGFNEKEIDIITNGIREHRRLPLNKSLLGKYLHRADRLSRQCMSCEAAGECYKMAQMETGHAQLIY